VGVADLALAVAALPLRLVRRRPGPPRRILLLRLERIGDLLMSLGAIRAVRRLAPDAVIDLVVGSWNAPIAELVPGIDRVEALDLPWLARGGAAGGAGALADRAWRWRNQRYDLAINFEGDIRSHLLMAASLAARRVGFDQAGGGAVLTDRVAHEPSAHTAENGLRLVERAFDLESGSLPRPSNPAAAGDWRLSLPEPLAAAGGAALDSAGLDRASDRPIVAMHVAGGRAIKQWPPARFAEVARRLAADDGARIVLTGSRADGPLVAGVAASLPPPPAVIDLSGRLDLLTLAAVLRQCDLLVTGDTGPMHMAAAVGTPVAAVFGPSSPARYAPLVASRIVRIDLPCAPCNRIRKPPERCQGGTPDCLSGLQTRAVLEAARSLLAERRAALRVF
jgi:heptosyltransferase-1